MVRECGIRMRSCWKPGTPIDVILVTSGRWSQGLSTRNDSKNRQEVSQGLQLAGWACVMFTTSKIPNGY